MSWDICIMNLPADVHSVSDIPHDFAPPPLGERAPLIAKILEFAPQADFSDPAWGELSTPGFTTEFNMGRDAVVDSLMVHVRGADSAVDFITALLQHLALVNRSPKPPAMTRVRRTEILPDAEARPDRRARPLTSRQRPAR